ncbi:hypothetical protein [Amnibacterium endophyticum]|uniref:AbiEi antitoxin C-terminal domain-containing protein n=1 Tax=Amnibacterium endophyticum TaxID=2109337 RepID=A0ABW4LIP6_9MICO
MTSTVDPWLLELIVVRGAHDGTARSALSRDAARGLLLRLRQGVYVERAAFLALGPEGQHLVRMRALAAVMDRPVVFSHQSAAVVHGIPVLRRRLDRLVTTVSERRERGQDGVSARLAPISPLEVMEHRGLLLTVPARTVVDLASALPFEEGVMAADSLLSRGMDRARLLSAMETAGARRARARIEQVIRFAHPGAESAAESLSRCGLLRLGIEPPLLQYRLLLPDGREVFLDMLFPTTRVGGEVDGAVKLLDPIIAPDARAALQRERRREDAVRLQVEGLARWGWLEAVDPPRLAVVLRAVGVLPSRPPFVLEDFAAAAAIARPRRATRQR